jgi:cation diffusion facilitator family transporter
MAIESIQRMYAPQAIRFNEAIIVACLGLAVNLICAYVLEEKHSHEHDQAPHHHDHNLRAAYLHVLADALTSVLAIVALLAGKYFQWNFLDPLMGLVGATIITRWAYGLLQDTSTILLDAQDDESLVQTVKETIEGEGDNRVSDLHVWQVGPDHHAAIISIVTHFPKPTSHYKNLLKNVTDLSHITVEVHRCKADPCILPEEDA